MSSHINKTFHDQRAEENFIRCTFDQNAVIAILVDQIEIAIPLAPSPAPGKNKFPTGLLEYLQLSN